MEIKQWLVLLWKKNSILIECNSAGDFNFVDVKPFVDVVVTNVMLLKQYDEGSGPFRYSTHVRGSSIFIRLIYLDAIHC